MPNTSVLAIPYQSASDPPDGPVLGQQLAERVDAVLSNGVESLTVGGVTTTNNIAIGGDLTVGDDVTVTGDLAVTGNLTATTGIGARILKMKAADESIISNATLQNDDDLFIALPANSLWAIQGFITVTCASATPDFAMAFTIPAAATMRIFAHNVSYANKIELTSSGASAAFALDIPDHGEIWFDGYVKTGATAGNLQYQWTQNASTATATIVKVGSWLRGERAA